MLDNYPPGAANDSRAPYNQPLSKHLIVEVSVELGTMVEIDVEDDDDLKDLLEQAIIEKFKIDDDDIILNDFVISNIQ